MTPLAIQLEDGALLRDIEKEDLPALDRLRELGAIEEKEGSVKLRSTHRIGKVFLLKDGDAYLISESKAHADLHIDKHNLHGAQTGDIVLARKLLAKRGKASAKVLFIIKQESLYTIAYKKQGRLLNIKNEFPVDFQADLKEGEVISIDGEGHYEKLGHIDDSAVDEQISLALFGRKESFSSEAQEQAKAYGKSVDGDMHPGRVDLRHLDFCTIDPVTAKDFDDAIYYDQAQNILYVAIADVSYYVNYYDAIDQEARTRGFSIYLPHKSIPMLPRVLSENLCSLNPHEDRLAFVCKLTLDTDYRPIKEEFFEALIHSKRRYNYDEVDELLQSGKFEREFGFIKKLYNVSQILRKRRLKKGFDFASEELKLRLDEQFNLEDISIETSTPSHSLIEECMLLANIASSKVNKESIYRVHDKPSLKKLETLLGELATVGIFVEEYEDAPELITKIQTKAREMGIAKEVDEMLIKSLKQATYSSDNIGHFGLGFESYSHFTSPIRRYSDLILHRLIKAKLQDDKKELGYLLRNIKPLCARVSNLEREADRVQRDYEKRKFARWAQAHLGESFEATVTQLEESSATATLETNHVDVTIRNLDFSLFDKISVTLTEANVATCDILGELSGEA